MKKFLSILLIFCMVTAMLPVSAQAETPEPISEATEYLSGQDEIVQTIRQGLVNREETITVEFVTDTWDENCGTAFMESALAHTGVPTEGDYLRWHLAGYETELSGYGVEDLIYCTLTYRVSYYTTAQQEAEVTEQVAALLSELNPSGSDYERIKCVYDWMCSNIVYDHANLENEAYTLKFSAYAALIDKTAVCQGYALLLYRLALELGIDCRIITGTSHDEAHAWNIVCLDGLYYNLDSTWDAGLSAYQYFLKCEENFADHQRDEAYTSESFQTTYPMAQRDYGVPADLIASGTTSCGQTWTIDQNGVLTISGTGDVESAWEDYQNVITKIVVNEGITNLSGLFFGHTKLKEVVLPSTIEDLGFALFSECLLLETVYLSEGTKRIGKFCFDGCVNLKSINFPSTLELIDEEAFRNTGLETVSISCPEIGYYAFTDCSSLREVILQDGVISIGEGAFSGDTALETVTLPSTLTSIGANAFGECKSLRSPIIIPEGVTTLENGTFSGCEKLEEVHLPSTLRSIGIGAFQSSGITSLTIPDSVEYINDAAFYGCGKLQGLDLGNGVKHIGAAFFHCSLPSLHLPASVETVDTTLWHTSMLAEVTVDPNNLHFTSVDGLLYNKDGSEIVFCPPKWEGVLIIPDTVTSLRNNVFAGCGSITSITIPDSVTAFGTNIFEGCGVNTVVLPGGMEAIPDSMFNQCHSLLRVNIPDSVTTIGDGAFRGCTNLETIAIPAGVIHIGSEAFSGCRSARITVAPESSSYVEIDGVLYTKDMKQLLFASQYAATDFTVPDGVEIIAAHSFSGLEALERVVLPDSVKHIGEYAFAYRDRLSAVVFGRGLESIGNSAFEYCTNLQDLVFADAEFSIGVSAFSSCTALTKVEIPGTVTRIDNVAFWNCTALSNIEIGRITEKVGSGILSGTAYYNNSENWENGCLYLSDWLITGEQLTSSTFAIPDGTYGIADSGLSGRNVLVEVTVPGSVKIIGDSAFAGCGALEIVHLSNGLERIGDLAFGCSSLGQLTIPATVTYIGWQFWIGPWILDSPNMLVFLGDAPEFHEQAFMNINPTVVYYPDGLVSWTTVVGSQFGSAEFTIEDDDGNVTTYPTVSWQSYTAEECPSHYWVMTQYLHDCAEGGEIEYTCLICEETRTETVAPAKHSLSETITAPTCTEGGYITRTCMYCEYVSVEVLTDAPGHSYGEWYTIMNPNCTDNGEQCRECEVCGHAETQVIEAHGHDYASVVTPPTCTTEGYTTHTCTICGDRYEDSYVDALEHSFGAWYVDAEPDCTSNGALCRECENCGHVETQTIDAVDHEYTPVITEPTCTEEGYTTHICTYCGDSYVDSYVDATGHCWDNGTVVVAPTESADGEMLYACSACGETRTEVIPKEDHVHSYEAVVTAPTCTEGGYTTHTCATCGDSYVDNYTEPLPHDFIAVVTEPTCTEGGYITHTCSGCGDSYVVPYYENGIGHSMGDWYTFTEATCTAKGQERRDCANCDHFETRETDMIPHTFESVVTAPTYEADGYTTYTCTVCGYSYEDDFVPALVHHEVLEGEDAQWSPESGAPVSVRVDAAIENFVNVLLNGEVLDEACYTVTEGSTIVTLKPEYLATLPAGEHMLELVFTDGGAEVTFEILAPAVTLGDVNEDSEIDILDANLVVAWYNEIRELEDDQLLAADVNGDGEVDIMDANMIVAYYNEVIDTFPAQH